MHSVELYGLLALCAGLVGVFGFLHARKYWEGLPPVLDGFVSMAAFFATVGAFVVGGRIGGIWNHPHAGRVIAFTLAVILIRIVRTWIGKEQIRYRAARARPKPPPADEA